MCAAAAAALREDPDVLVLEDVSAPALVTLALEAAAAGRLVIAGLLARDTSDAVERMVAAVPLESRRDLQRSLAKNLRGVVSQVLLKRRGGGRVAARERLVNTPEVARLLAEGRTSELSQAIEAGADHGMISLNEALARYVQSGDVDVQEAYRRSVNRAGFLNLLRGLGIDVSAINNGNG
jgi:twitching motility protein PilT